MKVRSCYPAGLPYCTQLLVPGDRISLFHIDPAHMAVHGHESATMVEKNCFTVKVKVSCERDFRGGRRFDRGTGSRRYVQPAVRIARLIVEYSTAPKRARGNAINWFQEGCQRMLQRAETPVLFTHQLAFPTDTLKVRWIRIYHLGIRNREPLLRVLFCSD